MRKIVQQTFKKLLLFGSLFPALAAAEWQLQVPEIYQSNGYSNLFYTGTVNGKNLLYASGDNGQSADFSLNNGTSDNERSLAILKGDFPAGTYRVTFDYEQGENAGVSAYFAKSDDTKFVSLLSESRIQLDKATEWTNKSAEVTINEPAQYFVFLFTYSHSIAVEEGQKETGFCVDNLKIERKWEEVCTYGFEEDENVSTWQLQVPEIYQPNYSNLFYTGTVNGKNLLYASGDNGQSADFSLNNGTSDNERSLAILKGDFPAGTYRVTFDYEQGENAGVSANFAKSNDTKFFSLLSESRIQLNATEWTNKSAEVTINEPAQYLVFLFTYSHSIAVEEGQKETGFCVDNLKIERNVWKEVCAYDFEEEKPNPTGVDDVSVSAKSIVCEKYHTVLGQPLAEPQTSGVTVVTRTYSDGSTSSSKEVR